MLRMEEIFRMEISASHWNGFFEWNDLKCKENSNCSSTPKVSSKISL